MLQFDHNHSEYLIPQTNEALQMFPNGLSVGELDTYIGNMRHRFNILCDLEEESKAQELNIMQTSLLMTKCLDDFYSGDYYSAVDKLVVIEEHCNKFIDKQEETNDKVEESDVPDVEN